MKVGDSVRRAELAPFEVDLLHRKLRQAKGTIRRIMPDLKPSYRRNYPLCYEVLWTWPDGETCITHHHRFQIEVIDE